MFTVARRGRDETDYRRKLDDYRSDRLITTTGTNWRQEDRASFPIESPMKSYLLEL